ncbi:hypothetical protein [Neotabrizicola sp. sgz301269]|uniref:hypothetical protein n=1 Tax=Neotabrizicola sp. sgz301269 TaxID=3276282 RepID=UPI003770598A
MAFQFSTAVRNAWLDAIEAAIGTSVTLEIRTGAAPANCAAADSGTVLATITLPADWMAAAAAGAKAMQGIWQDASADASGTAGHFRIKVGGTCHIQGSCSGIGGGGDMIIDNPALVATQQFNLTSFGLTAGGA